MKLFEYSYDKDKYVVEGTLIFELKLDTDPADAVDIDLKILRNGKEMSNFGSTWAGNKLNRYDFFGAVVAAYYNGDKRLDFTYVYQEIVDGLQADKKTRKIIMKPDDSVRASISEKIMKPNGDSLTLSAISVDENDTYYGAYYVGNDGMVMTYADGSIATDITAFAEGSLISDAEEGKITWAQPEVYDWLEADYGIENPNKEVY